MKLKDGRIEISEEIMEVLRAGKILGSNYYLPPQQLDREMYIQVNKILELLGGKWNRSAHCHIFQEGIVIKLKETLENGQVSDMKKKFQFYETPRVIARQMINLAQLKEGDAVLEPSAGKGAILDCLPTNLTLDLVVIEINPEYAEVLAKKRYLVRTEDFLKFNTHTFDKIIMNPPFTLGQDAGHILHAYSLLKNGGRIVAIAPASITEKSQREYRDVQFLICNVINLPECSFKESGTKVNTKIVIINK